MRFRVLGWVLVLWLGLTLVAPILLASDCSLPYIDEFDNPASGWERKEEVAEGCDYIGGDYAIWSNLSAMLVYQWAPVSVSCATSFVIETAAYLQKDVVTAYCGIVIEFGSDDAYWFRVAPQGLFGLAHSRDGASQTPSVPWTKCQVMRPSPSKNDISVVVTATTAALRVNGTTLISINLEVQSPSRVGVFVGGASEKDRAEARFTSFSVRGATEQDIVAAQPVPPSEAASPALHDLPFADTFDDPRSGWLTTSSESGSLQYVDGAYSMSVKEAQRDWPSWAPLASTCPANFSVEGTAYVASTARDATSGLQWGLGPDDFYWFRVSADGYYSVYQRLKGVWQDALVKWTVSEQIQQQSGENHLRVVVVGDEAMIEVNGTALGVVQLAMPGPYKVGIVGGARDSAPAEVRFTSFSVREGTSADAAALEAAKPVAPVVHALPFTDSFDDPRSGWLAVSGESGSLQYIDGAYSMSVKQANQVWPSWAPLASTCPANFVVEATAYVASGAGDAECGLGWGWGVGDEDFYSYSCWFTVSAEGSYRVREKQAGTWKTTLLDWTKSGEILQGSAENRLRVVVVGSEAMIEVNGKALGVVKLTWPGPFKVGIAAGTGDVAAAEVRFTSFSVREGTSADTAALQAAKPAPPVVHSLPFADSFDDPRSGWLVVSNESGSRQYVNGTYSMSLKEAQMSWRSWAPLASTCPADFSVEATAYVASTTRDAQCGLVWGLGSDDLYLFRVSADGYYSVGQKLKGVWQDALVKWTVSEQIQQQSGENHLRVVVVGNEAMIEVNGTALGVVQLTMPGPYKVGIAEETGDVAPAEVRFTSFLVRAATKGDIAALQAARTIGR